MKKKVKLILSSFYIKKYLLVNNYEKNKLIIVKYKPQILRYLARFKNKINNSH